MEHIDIDIDCVVTDEQRPQAISQLIQIPPPPGVFGSFTGGPYLHHFFEDGEPPVLFSSSAEPEGYINRCLEFLNRLKGRQDKVDFSNEPLLCYYADIHKSNFPIDRHGQLWVIDFALSGVLPACFMEYAIRAHPIHPLPLSIRETIPLARSPNIGPLGRAAWVAKVVYNDFHIPPEEHA